MFKYFLHLTPILIFKHIWERSKSITERLKLQFPHQLVKFGRNLFASGLGKYRQVFAEVLDLIQDHVDLQVTDGDALLQGKPVGTHPQVFPGERQEWYQLDRNI